MKLLKTLIAFENEDGKLYLAETIEHKEMFWLVPSWLGTPDGKWMLPERIVCISNLRHQKSPAGSPSDFVLNDPLPRAVYEGRIPKEGLGKYIVVERPDIKLRNPSSLN